MNNFCPSHFGLNNYCEHEDSEDCKLCWESEVSRNEFLYFNKIRRKELKIMNLEELKEDFKNYKAKFTDCENIKILDFINPNSYKNKIRFLFDENDYKLCISGSFGNLMATDYNNMTYKKFDNFVNDIEYFEKKIDCCSRDLYEYDECYAREDLKRILEENDLLDEVLNSYSGSNKLESFYNDVFSDFSCDTGIGDYGIDVLSRFFNNLWDFVDNIGKRSTGILDLYILAFKMAKQQIKNQ